MAESIDSDDPAELVEGFDSGLKFIGKNFAIVCLLLKNVLSKILPQAKSREEWFLKTNYQIYLGQKSKEADLGVEISGHQ